EFKATMTGLTDSQILKVQYTSHTWRLAGTQGGVSTYDVKSLSIAVDNVGVPYVAYSENGSVSVKRFNGASWALLGPPDFISSDDVIVAMDGNVPCLAYVDNAGSIRVKKWNGGSWVNIGGIAGRVSSNGNPNGNHHFSFDVSNGRFYILSLSPTSGKNILMKFDGLNWIELGPELAQTYYYFAMDAANGKPYAVMVNKGGRPRVMLYENGWIDLVNPNETPILNCTVDVTSIRIGNNNFNVDIAVDEKTNTVCFLGDCVKGTDDGFEIKIVRNGRIVDVAGMGSDDPDDLNILAFNGRAVLAYEDHENYVGYDPAGINFEFTVGGEGSPPALRPINKLDQSTAYIDGAKLITLSGGGDRLYTAYSDVRLGGRVTVLSYLP
ncbi:MAG TPA: hypothetical protein VHR47_13335, partial [Bacillota bacterium]|nr:hypothetical protein [Bacillota bacterium]